MEEAAFIGNNVWVLEHLQDVHLVECSLALLLGHLLDGDLFDHQQRVIFDLTHKIHLAAGEGRGGEGRGGEKGRREEEKGSTREQKGRGRQQGKYTYMLVLHMHTYVLARVFTYTHHRISMHTQIYTTLHKINAHAYIYMHVYIKTLYTFHTHTCIEMGACRCTCTHELNERKERVNCNELATVIKDTNPGHVYSNAAVKRMP